MYEDFHRTSKNRKIGAGLMIGIVFLPIVFSWLTLRQGYRRTDRIVAFVWLGLSIIFIIIMPLVNNALEQQSNRAATWREETDDLLRKSERLFKTNRKKSIPEPTPLEQLNKLESLPEILSILTPSMKDTRGEVDPVALLLATWMNSHPNWKELNSTTETKYKLVMKDPVAERGKLLCKRGKISQIQVDRSIDPPVAIGGIVSGWTDVTRFIAVGSSGELVDGKRATICGIVTGLNSYKNVSGGITHSVQVVGMFDLAANRKLGDDSSESQEPSSKSGRKRKQKREKESSQNLVEQQNTPTSSGGEGGSEGVKLFLDRADVEKGMNPVAGKVKQCGQGQLGTITIKAVIDSTGSVISAVATGPFTGTPVGSCAARAVLTAKFPKSQKGLTVRYPFKLF